MTLYVKVISAALTRDTDMFSNMDPYVAILVGPQKQRTKTLQEAGKKPRWEQQLIFRPKATSMLVTVYDEDVVSDDVVGSVNIQLKKYMNNQVGQEQNFSLSYKGQSAGTVRLKIRYQSLGQPNNIPANPYGNQQYNQSYGNPQYNQAYNTNSNWQTQPNQTNPYYQTNGWGNQNMHNNSNQQLNQQIYGGIIQASQPSNNYRGQTNQNLNSMKSINEQLVGLVQPNNQQNMNMNSSQKPLDGNGIWQNILNANLVNPQQNNPQNNGGWATQNGSNGWNNNNNWGNQNNGWGSNNKW